MQTIYTADASAGAGKTYGACVWALEQARKDRKVAIVQPSKELIKQTRKTLAKLGCDNISVIEITSRTQPGKVTSALIDHVKHSPEEVGGILLITHAAFIDLPYWHRPGNWIVIVDELLTVVTDLSLTIPEEHKRLTEQVKLQSFNPTYSRMIPAETQSFLTSLATNPRHDQVWSVFTETAKRLLDPNWSVFAKTSNYHRIMKNDGEADAHKLMTFGRLHSRVVLGFTKVILMGAMLEESILCSLWSAEGVAFKPHPIQDSLRYQKHDNGHLITIEHLWDRPWSKNFRDKKLPNSNQTVWDHVVSKTLEAVGDDPYIYLVNKDVEETMAERFTGGTAVSTVCHGLNRYDNIHKAVFLSALNPAPAHFAFVDTLGVNPDELRRAMYLQSLYQAVMRISTRDPNSTAKKHVVVLDKDAAEYLETHFPGCTVKRSADTPAMASKTGGRKKVCRDNAAKAPAAKTKQRIINEAVKLGHGDAARSISVMPSVYSTDVIDYEITSNQALMTGSPRQRRAA